MKFVLFLLAALLLSGCEAGKDYNERHIDSVVRKLAYTKDRRTGLCFGYAWTGTGQGGPALVVVPCEAVGLSPERK